MRRTNIDLTNTMAEYLVVDIQDESILANGVTTTLVTATVYNASNQTVPNISVQFESSGSGSFTPLSAITNESGVASSVFRSSALEDDEATTVTISIDGAGVDETIIQRGVNMSMTSNVTQIPANGSSTAILTLRLQETSTFMGVPNASITIGSNFGLINSSVATDSTGTARLTYTAGYEIGEAEIIARYGNLITDTVRINQFAPAAAVLDLGAEETSILGNGIATSELVTVITDQVGTPVSGVQVAWSINGPGALFSATSITDEDGLATNYYRAPATNSDVTCTVYSSSASALDSVVIESRGIRMDITSAIQQLPANGRVKRFNSDATARDHEYGRNSQCGDQFGNLTWLHPGIGSDR